MAVGPRMLNGQVVPWTAAEEAAIQASWDAEPARKAQDAADTLALLRSQALAVWADVNGDVAAQAKAMRALALLTLDEVNVLRQWIAAFKVQVAAATNLANLQFRIAGLPATPDRTIAQLKTAMQGKITAGSADS